MKVEVIKLDHYQKAYELSDPQISEAPLPMYQSSGAAAIDLHSALDYTVSIGPGGSFTIPTGLKFNINDPSVAMLVYTRSGNGFKHGIQLRNNVGVIDSDYQGEVMVKLVNTGSSEFLIKPFDRIAQAIFTPVIQAELVAVDEFTVKSERGENGFGSTGK